MYQVESIIGKRLNSETKTVEYKVKWANFPTEKSTWMPQKQLKFVKQHIQKYNLGNEQKQDMPLVSQSCPNNYEPDQSNMFQESEHSSISFLQKEQNSEKKQIARQQSQTKNQKPKIQHKQSYTPKIQKTNKKLQQTKIDKKMEVTKKGVPPLPPDYKANKQKYRQGASEASFVASNGYKQPKSTRTENSLFEQKLISLKSSNRILGGIQRVIPPRPPPRTDPLHCQLPYSFKNIINNNQGVEHKKQTEIQYAKTIKKLPFQKYNKIREQLQNNESNIYQYQYKPMENQGDQYEQIYNSYKIDGLYSSQADPYDSVQLGENNDQNKTIDYSNFSNNEINVLEILNMKKHDDQFYYLASTNQGQKWLSRNQVVPKFSTQLVLFYEKHLSFLES